MQSKLKGPGRQLSLLLSISSVHICNISNQGPKPPWTPLPHRVCCSQHLAHLALFWQLLISSSVTFSTWAMAISLPFYLLSNCQTISLRVPCYEWAFARAKLGDCQPTVYLSVRGVHGTDPFLGYALASRLGKSHNEWNEEMAALSHFINIPWEISVNIDIRI